MIVSNRSTSSAVSPNGRHKVAKLQFLQATRNVANEMTLGVVNSRIPAETYRYFAEPYDMDQAETFHSPWFIP